MFQKIKHSLYFPIASYFRFFASIKLKIWNPKVIVVTGSSGKTTLLHLIESQLGNLAKYSHKANSSFGIPFDILGIHRNSLSITEWPKIFLLPFINLLKPVPKENIYVVEADCDRPNEGRFLSELLKPDITLWTNVSRTHSMNFETLVKNGKFNSVEEAIAHEFGYFSEKTKSLVILNSDSDFIMGQATRISCKTEKVSLASDLKKYNLSLSGTEFETRLGNFSFPYLLPKELATSILMSLSLVDYLKFNRDIDFSKFSLPPGRNSMFKGIKNITIVDSSYNANIDSMGAVINMFNHINTPHKWIVLGDMLEQGSLEKEEHEKLATIISQEKYERIILMGPRISKYTFPKLKNLVSKETIIEHFIGPKEVLDYIEKNIKGGEIILFKGARFLEGVIDNLLLDKKESEKLPRRERVWEIRRKKWGL
jgi:UDP-N-acetylmuramyl pentapeptide synthase